MNNIIKISLISDCNTYNTHHKRTHKTPSILKIEYEDGTIQKINTKNMTDLKNITYIKPNITEISKEIIIYDINYPFRKMEKRPLL